MAALWLSGLGAWDKSLCFPTWALPPVAVLYSRSASCNSFRGELSFSGEFWGWEMLAAFFLKVTSFLGKVRK